jgi:galactose oxidase-like protein
MFRPAGFLFASVLLFGVHSAQAANLGGEHPLNAKPHTEGKNFTSNASMEVGRAAHTATLLPNHNVLIAGGFSSESTYASLASAEIYNSKTATFSYTGSMTAARSNHTATLLANGEVLIAGGSSIANSPPFVTATTEIYDPATGVFTATGSMTTPREYHTATLLPDGTVLIAGGDDNTGAALDSAELYNPATGAFTSVGSMTTARDQPTATLLTSGKVLIAGGSFPPLNSAELYDPATQTFTLTGSMLDAREVHTATLLTDGKVLMAGGAGANGPLASAELFDPGTGTFSATGSLTAPRYGHTATSLKNGNVLIATGYSLISPLLIFEPSFTAEIYNSAKGTFTATGPMVAGRINSAATLLHTGNVLFTGGVTDDVVSDREFFFTDNISELFKLSGGRCTPGQPGCGWRGGDLLTFNQYFWPSPYYPASTWLVSDFNEVYGGQGGLMILGGAPSGNYLLFDNGEAVLEFLPQSGPPAPLDQSYFDETSSSAGEYGGDIVALKLNIDFSDAGILLGNPKIAFGDLTLCNLGSLSALNGYTVRQFLGVANTVLAGGTGPYDIGAIDSVTQVLNDTFENENVSTFAQQNLVNGPCP